MKKTENYTIITERSTGKLNAAIDYFVHELELIANDDKVNIKTIHKPSVEMLEIHSYYNNFCVLSNVKTKMIFANADNIKRFAHFVYDGIKNNIIAHFEYIELLYKYEEKSEEYVDEHWEFIELGGI